MELTRIKSFHPDQMGPLFLGGNLPVPRVNSFMVKASLFIGGKNPVPLQDRLVKEMRLSGIDTIAAGNAFLPAFMEKYNARFAKAPFDDRDVHRSLVAGHDDLDDAFAWKEERTVSVNLTLQYDQVLFILEPTG